MSNPTLYDNPLLRFWYGSVRTVRMDVFQKVFTLSFGIYMLQRFAHAKEWLTEAGFHVKIGGTFNQPFLFPLLPEWAVAPFGAAVFITIAAVILGWQRKIFEWLHVCIGFLYSKCRLCRGLYAEQIVCDRLSDLCRHLASQRDYERVAAADPCRRHCCSCISWRVIARFAIGTWFQNPYTLYSQLHGHYCTDACAQALYFVPLQGWTVFMYSALIFELIAPVLFMRRSLRPLAMVWGIGFHPDHRGVYASADLFQPADDHFLHSVFG